jgi:hypothetical protein
MKLKLIATAILLSTGLAQALENFNQPFTLSCEGSEGIMFFEQTSKGISYAVVVGDVHTSGFVQPYLEYDGKFEQGGATIIDPSYEHGKFWLSVHATHGYKKNIPEHYECMATRVVGKCIWHKVRAYDINVSDDYVNAMVDMTDKKNVTFMSIDVPGQEMITTLGENTQCTLETPLVH